MLMLIYILKSRSCWCCSGSLKRILLTLIHILNFGACWCWSVYPKIRIMLMLILILKSESCWCWFLSSNPDHVDAHSYLQIRITLLLIRLKFRCDLDHFVQNWKLRIQHHLVIWNICKFCFIFLNCLFLCVLDGGCSHQLHLSQFRR